MSEAVNTPRQPRARTRRALRMLTVAVLLAALGITGVTVLLPLHDDDPSWAALWLSQTLQRQIQVAALELDLEDGVPMLELSDVTVRSDTDRGEGLTLGRVKVELSLLQSLRHGRLYPRRIRIVGAQLSLHRRTGGLVLEGLGRQRRPARELISAILGALPEGCEFSLEQAGLRLPARAQAGDAASVLITPLRVGLTSDDAQAQLTLDMDSEEHGSLRAQARWRYIDGPGADVALSVNASAVPVARIAEIIGVRSPQRLGGLTDLDLEAEMVDGGLATARGALTLNDLQHGPGRDTAPAAGALKISTLFDLDHAGERWQLNLLRFSLHERGASDGSPGSGRILSTAWDTGPYDLELDALSLGQLRALASSLAPAYRSRFEGLIGAGRLENIAVRIPPLDAAAEPVQVKAVFRGLTLREAPVDLAPASGTLALRGRAGSVDLEPLTLTLPAHAAAAGRPVIVTGGIDFSIDDQGLSLRARELRVAERELRAQVLGTLRYNAADASVASDLSARIAGLRATDLVRHISSVARRERLRRWLENAFPTGRLSNVTVEALGTSRSLAQFTRRLRVRADLQDLTLVYSARWPEITGIKGQLWVHWPQLGFQLDDGIVSGTRITSAVGRIEDMTEKTPRLLVEGEIAGAMEKGTAFLLKSPLKRRFTGLLSQLSARGAANLDLRLDIPLGIGKRKVGGRLRVHDNTLALPAFRTDMRKVGGSIRFSEAGVSTGSLKADYLDGPIEATLDGTRSPGRYTDLAITGRTTPEGLIRHLHGIGILDTPRSDDLPLLQRLDGETAGTVELRIPSAANPDQSLPLRVHTDLKGMALKLPAPLGKSRDALRSLEIRTRLGAAPRRLFQIAYGKRSRLLLQVRASEQGYAFDRAGVRFGGDPAHLPDKSGRIQVGGRLGFLSVDDWLGLIAEAGQSMQARSAGLGAVNEVDVRAERLDTLGNEFQQVRLQLRRAGDGEQLVTLDGPEVKGNIHIPLPLKGRTIVGTFQRLYATAKDESERAGARAPGTLLEVGRFPAMDVTVDDLRYGTLKLGRGAISMRPARNGVRVETLELINPAYGVTGKGTWRARGTGQRTDLRLTLEGKDLGTTLQAFGYSDNGLQGAPVKVELAGHWNGSPLAFALARMNGALELRAGKGRFTNVDPGATGRVFGLLSVTMLPRRLFRLDFSDLFGKGIGFRRIRGRFEVEGGNAYTNSFTLDADTAQVDIVGRVGLASRDYDQIMTVAPKLSTSLPLAPLWLAEQVLDRKLLDPAFAYRYSITGSWDDPVVERMRKEFEEDPDRGEQR